MPVMNNLQSILNLLGNISVMSKRVHDLAYDQFCIEHKEGSRSDSRGIMLAEIGTASKEILNQIERIKLRLDLLDEIDPQYDLNAKEEELPLHIF